MLPYLDDYFNAENQKYQLVLSSDIVDQKILQNNCMRDTRRYLTWCLTLFKKKLRHQLIPSRDIDDQRRREAWLVEKLKKPKKVVSGATSFPWWLSSCKKKLRYQLISSILSFTRIPNVVSDSRHDPPGSQHLEWFQTFIAHQLL